MSCNCNETTNQGKQYCQECMPDEFHWLVPVSKEPDPFLMDRNHAYIDPNNIIYVLSRDRVRAIKITTSEGNIDLSPYALKEELASKISELTTKLTQGLEGAKYFEGEGIRIDEGNIIHSTVNLTEVNQRLGSLEQVDTSPYKAGTGIEITPDLTIKSTVDVSGLDSRVQDLEEQEDKDTKYTAGAGLQLRGTEFSVNPNDLPGTDQLVDINTRVTALENDTDADTKYTAGTNIQISSSNVISATDTKYTAGAVTYAMLAQDVRTAITGGNTAVVGTNAVSTVNVVDGSMTNEKMSRAAVQVHFIPDGTLRAVDLDSASGILSFGADACIYWNNTYLRIPANHVVDLKVSWTNTAGLLLIDLTSGSVSAQTAGSVIPAGTAILGAIRRDGTKYHFTGAIADSIRIDGVRQGAKYGPISPAGFYCGPNGYLSYDPVAKTLTALRSGVYFYSNEGEFSLPTNTVITAEGTVGAVVKLCVNFTNRTAKIVNATNYNLGAFVEVARFELSDIGIFDSSSQFIRLYHRSAKSGNIEFFPSATGRPYYDPARQKVNWMCVGDQAYIKYNDHQVHQLAVGASTDLPASIASSFMFMLNPTTGQVACKPAYNTFSKENEICIGGGRRGPDRTFHFWGVPIFYIGAEPAVSQTERGLGGGSIAVSHRGYNRTMPEQGADSYLMAKSYGATTWEADIQFTRDGIPVLHHDLTINRIARTADGLQLTQSVNIADKTLAELNTYDYGIGKHAYFAGTKILTFENWVKLAHTLGVEKLFPEWKIRINAAQAQVMLNILKKWNMYDKTYWLSFDWANFDIMSSVDDKTGFIFLGATDANISTMAPYRNGKREVWASPNWSVITETQAQTLKDNGYKLYIWTVGSESNVNKFKNVAVDSFGYDGGIHIGLTQLAELMRDSI